MSLHSLANNRELTALALIKFTIRIIMASLFFVAAGKVLEALSMDYTMSSDYVWILLLYRGNKSTPTSKHSCHTISADTNKFLPFHVFFLKVCINKFEHTFCLGVRFKRSAKQHFFLNCSRSNKTNVNQQMRHMSYVSRLISVDGKKRRCLHLLKNLTFNVICELIDACLCSGIRRRNLC